MKFIYSAIAIDVFLTDIKATIPRLSSSIQKEWLYMI